MYRFNRKALSLVLLCTALPSVASGSSAISHKIEYGLINFDQLHVINNMSDIPTLGVYTYYFDPLEVQGAPYDLAARMSRTNWLQTDLLMNLLGLINVSGVYHFDTGYDLEFQTVYSSGDGWLSSQQQNLYTGAILNFSSLVSWQYGVGIRNTFTERDRYYSSDGASIKVDSDKYDVDAQLVFQAKYTEINDGKGWFVETQFRHDVESKGNFLNIAANYFSDINESLTLKMAVKETNRHSYDSSVFLLGVARKYWFSENTAIDYGVSYSIDVDKHERHGRETHTYFNFDINGTWRF